MESDPILLAIESSCDDTSAAVLQGRTVLSNKVAGQDVHREYGGVVPELASRAHQQHIVPVVEMALKEAGITKSDLDAVAYTQGPGLLGSLLVGSSYAKGLALGLSKPLIPVHHMDAHVMAHFIDDPLPQFPFLCLVVSGGHTQLVLMEDETGMKIVGKTRDDAAGEAFDKTAKMLGLPYPGGPLIDQYAQQGNAEAYRFPRSKMEGYDFSFSGLKTAILYFVRDGIKEDQSFVEANLNDICASVQYSIVSYLLDNLKRAAEDLGVEHIGIAGGVSANSSLRAGVQDLAKQKGWKSYIPKFEYCTDNAAMIGITAYYKFKNEEFGKIEDRPFTRQETRD